MTKVKNWSHTSGGGKDRSLWEKCIDLKVVDWVGIKENPKLQYLTADLVVNNMGRYNENYDLLTNLPNYRESSRFSAICRWLETTAIKQLAAQQSANKEKVETPKNSAPKIEDHGPDTFEKKDKVQEQKNTTGGISTVVSPEEVLICPLKGPLTTIKNGSAPPELKNRKTADPLQDKEKAQPEAEPKNPLRDELEDLKRICGTCAFTVT